jgi:transposase
MSYSRIQAFLKDVLGVDFATGYLAKLVRKAGDALGPAYTGLLKALPEQTHLNVDETGHKECGNKWWTWCLRAAEFTVFKIDESRGSEVLLDVLGDEFKGVLGCDYFSAYRKYMKDVGCQVQFCLAHLIRDVKYLTTLGGRDRKYGERLLDCLRGLFHTIHRREAMRPARFRRAMERWRKRLIHVATHPPWTSKAENIAKRFRRHGESYVRFITTPGIEPTNNVVERALRFVVMQRRMTQGTRGKAGRTWSERIWTAVATCRQQGRSTYECLHNALDAHFTGQPAPSLLHP